MYIDQHPIYKMLFECERQKLLEIVNVYQRGTIGCIEFSLQEYPNSIEDLRSYLKCKWNSGCELVGGIIRYHILVSYTLESDIDFNS